MTWFTWVDLDENSQMSDVPMRTREQLRVLWLNGAKVEALAATFRIPEEWVEIFVRDTYETKPH
jgi:hypothetical protein